MIEVVCGVIEREGRILLGQRPANDKKHPGKWEFPGGKVEPGEAAAVALQREVREELGADCVVFGEMHRYEFAYPGKDPVRLIFLHAGLLGELCSATIYGRIEWVEPAGLSGFDILEGDLAFLDWLEGSKWFGASGI